MPSHTPQEILKRLIERGRTPGMTVDEQRQLLELEREERGLGVTEPRQSVPNAETREAPMHLSEEEKRRIIRDSIKERMGARGMFEELDEREGTPNTQSGFTNPRLGKKPFPGRSGR